MSSPDTQEVLEEVRAIQHRTGSRQEALNHVEETFREHYRTEGHPDVVAFPAARRVAEYLVNLAGWKECDYE